VVVDKYLTGTKVPLLLIAALLPVVFILWPRPVWALPEGTLMQRIEALAAAHQHGYRDVEPSVEEMDRIAAERPVETTCGYVSRWAAEHLNRAGYPTRIVDTLTLDEWNGEDDGHVLIEVWTEGDWVAIDIDQGVTFGGLSLVEWVARVPIGNYEIVPFEDGVDVGAMREWHQRIAQVPLIREGGKVYFPDGPWAERVMSYHPSYTPVADWAERFYP
jgi:hypothetical protein